MSTYVKTGKCRASYVHIITPQSIRGSDPKYSISLIIPKEDTTTIRAIEAAVEEAIEKGRAALTGKLTGNIVKEIYVPGKIVNIVVKG